MWSGQGLHQIFAEVAARHPDRIALTAGEQHLSYAELNERAEQVAGRLRALGVNRETLVGLCTHRGPELIVGMLGILKAGGAYLPIDPDYPASRVNQIVADSGIAVVATVSEMAGTFPAHPVPVLLDFDGESTPTGSVTDDGQVSGHDLAYVIYTSGSTGTPKGVHIEHHNVVRLFEQTRDWFGFTEHDVWTCFHSASFDFSVWEIWGALLHGGRLVMVAPQLARSPARFRELLEREQVTVLNQTPSAFRNLIVADTGELDTLRYVILGGERLDVKLLEPWLARYGDDRPALVNMYGITETTVHVTYRRIRHADLAEPDRSPIGVPIPDLTLLVLDEAGQPVADGVPGELFVAGAGVARGYLNRPELTSERFAQGRYRTGDKVMRTSDGELLYLGRVDDQIKIRGYRIEPAEVEKVLTGHACVARAVVAGHDFGDGDVRLVGYVVAKDPTAQLPAELAALAKRELPAHLRPSEYRLLTELPLTGQGKVDRAALWYASSTRPAASDVDSAQGAVGIIAGLVAEVLGRPVDPRADLFDCGATSLAFVRIITSINAHFGVGLTGAELGETASVHRLAACVGEAGRKGG